jgi:hypothetical protein
MTTVIAHACKSLAYLYKHTKNSNSKEKHQKFVNGIINIIKDFIESYPDNWKLMEVQYPLMAYLIYSRSFSLIKYILFGVNGQITEKLHKPQNKYVSYPYYKDLELDKDLELELDNNLESNNDLELNNENNDSESNNDLNPKKRYLESANDLTLALKFCQGNHFRFFVILSLLINIL